MRILNNHSGLLILLTITTFFAAQAMDDNFRCLPEPIDIERDTVPYEEVTTIFVNPTLDIVQNFKKCMEMTPKEFEFELGSYGSISPEVKTMTHTNLDAIIKVIALKSNREKTASALADIIKAIPNFSWLCKVEKKEDLPEWIPYNTTFPTTYCTWIESKDYKAALIKSLGQPLVKRPLKLK